MFTTYHSKIYLLANDNGAWCSIGSNNLTGGGMWTNFESAALQEYKFPEQKAELENIYSIIEKYSDSQYPCSTRITSINDINTLLDANYITKEISQKINEIKKNVAEKENHKRNHLFGSESVSMPFLMEGQSGRKRKEKTSKKEEEQAWENYEPDIMISNQKPAFTNEQFWFEMRKSTGGSRNILDLSKLGRIVSGSVAKTPYEYKESGRMYGGIKFFEIDPEDTKREKDITINYLGKDYYPSTIKFTPDNGSWRIQLKGEPSDGTEELSKCGDFVQKILVFEKITPDYYVLSVLEESELDKIKGLSRVWGLNGSSSASRAYGML